jgi:RNA polymerase sigma factor (sigma-70 family)
MCASIAPQLVDGCGALDASDERGEQRIGQWFSEWRQPVRHWLSRHSKVPAAELDDLAQEVFLRLLRYSLETHVTNPLGYLLRIASNVASEWRERARVAKPHESSWLEGLLIDEMDEPEQSVDRELYDAQFRQALEMLPVRQRQVLQLTWHEGLSCRQIAQELSVTERVVHRDRSRAYHAVRLTMQEKHEPSARSSGLGRMIASEGRNFAVSVKART